MSGKPKSMTWTQVKKQIQGFSQAGLLDLIHQMYNANDLNKAFLMARFQPEATLGSTELEAMKKQIHRYMCRRHTTAYNYYLVPKYGPARKIITEYKKTKDVLGTLDLMLAYVEAGNKFTQTYGDIDARFYDSVCAMLDAFAKLFRQSPEAYMPHFQERLRQLSRKSAGIGWGYSDHVKATISELGA